MSSGMKILYHHRIASRDGQATHVEEMVQALIELGHEVHECGPSVYKKDSGEAGSAGWVGRVKALLPVVLYQGAEVGYSLLAFARLARQIQRLRPDVIYERYALRNLAGVWAAALFRVPLLLEVNAPYAVVELQRGGRVDWRWVERYVWRRADRLFPVSQVLADMAAEEGIDRSRLRVIGNGVRLERYTSLASVQDAKGWLGLSGRTVIGFTGFVCDWDRLDRIVRWIGAYRSVDDSVHLLVVGDGPPRGLIEDLAEELAVGDRVTFTGVVPRDDVPRYAAAFDVALQTALVPFASPLCLFEYMAMGKAIVGPDQPNHREVLKSGVDALLYDPESSGDLERCIQALVENPPLRSRLASCAREAVVERGFTWRDHARRVIAEAQAAMR